MRPLFPGAAVPADPAVVYGDWPAPSGRPGVRVNMIASADGASAVDGTSGGLGGPADRRIYLLLRSLADVALVGAGTVRAEGYGAPALPSELVAAREARGQAPLPRLAVVSRSCDLPWDASLFTSPASRPFVVTVAAAPDDRRARAARVADVVVAGEEIADLERALVALGEAGARAVLCEGGPGLNGQLLRAGLVDELCLTVAPMLVAGAAGRIATGPPLVPPVGLELASALEEDGFLFLRYRALGGPGQT